MSKPKTSNAKKNNNDRQKNKIEFATIDRIYDFVELFPESKKSDLSSYASSSESVGGVAKASIFQPTSENSDSKIEYHKIKLPKLDRSEKLFLHYNIGLHDEIDLEYPLTKPGKIEFTVEISSKKPTTFTQFSVEQKWQENLIELTKLSGQNIKITFITRSDRHTKYNLALWGEPQILKISSLKETKNNLKFQSGIAIGESENGEIISAELTMDRSCSPKKIIELISEKIDRRNFPKLTFCSYLPNLEIIEFGTRRAITASREDFKIQCRIRNSGSVPTDSSHNATIAIHQLGLRRGRNVQAIKHLAPKDELVLTWDIRKFSHPSSAEVTASLRYTTLAGQIDKLSKRKIEVCAAPPQIPSKKSKEIQSFTVDRSIVLENGNMRVVFIHGDQGYKYIKLNNVKNNHYKTIAICVPILEISYRRSKDEEAKFNFLPTTHRMAGNSRGEAKIVLLGEFTDDDGGKWNAEIDFILADKANLLLLNYSVSVDQQREEVKFSVPNLHVGGEPFRPELTTALFPGVEFLDKNEKSSPHRSTPPINEITMPLMAIAHDSSIFGMLWKPNAKFSGTFELPNRIEDQDNNLINLLTHQNGNPLTLKPSQKVEFSMKLLIDGAGELSTAIDCWISSYGMPPDRRERYSNEEQLLLTRHALTEVMWEEKSGKFRPGSDRPAVNAPGVATLLWHDYLLSGDEEVKKRASEIANNAIGEFGKGGLIAEAGCNILRWELPFYIGALEPAMTLLQQLLHKLIASQRTDGSWRISSTLPTTGKSRSEANFAMGTEVNYAKRMLKYARISGDQKALKAGEKSLKFIDRFEIPENRPSGGIAFQTPQLLSIANAIAAYLEAYKITGKPHYLKRSEHWATIGLAFLYHYKPSKSNIKAFTMVSRFDPEVDRKAMEWYALAYSYHLQHLSEHGNRHDWKRIARNITNLAMSQQLIDGKFKGTLSIDGGKSYRSPEGILLNDFALRGLDPDISTAIIRTKKVRIHLSSGAKVENTKFQGGAVLEFDLRYFQGEFSHTIISGYGKIPENITFDGGTVPEVAELDDVKSGWLYGPDRARIFLKHLHETEVVRFKIS